MKYFTAILLFVLAALSVQAQQGAGGKVYTEIIASSSTAVVKGAPFSAEAVSESGVLAQQSFLFRELPPQAAIQRDVSGNVRVQHDGSPGHGCAIFMSIGRSTLA